MNLIPTQTVTANLCSCKDRKKFIISGDSGLFNQPDHQNVLILPLSLTGDNKISILQSILVTCSCGHITVHHPETTYGRALKWYSKKLWKGWCGRHINLYWHHRLDDKQRTLQNVAQILMHSIFDRAVEKGFFFINVPRENYIIHPEHQKVAEKVFRKLLRCKTYHGFKRDIDYIIRDCLHQSTLIGETILDTQNVFRQYLPALRQEMYNIRGISKSNRLKELRLVLEKLCIEAKISLPELEKDMANQPEIITQLLSK